jgi:hypothetical protein
MVGDKCPECGTVIEQLAPAWWNIRSLAEIERASRRAKHASVALLPAVIVALAMAAMDWWSLSIDGHAIAALCVLSGLQTATQASAVETVARQPVGEGIRRRLRVANAVRALVVLAAAVVVAGVLSEAISLPMGAALALWISATILLAGADFAAMNACNALMVEIDWSDTRMNEGLTSIAAAMLLLAAASALVPSCGWLFAPILWVGALVIALRGLERFARAGRLFLEGRT